MFQNPGFDRSVPLLTMKMARKEVVWWERFESESNRIESAAIRFDSNSKKAFRKRMIRKFRDNHFRFRISCLHHEPTKFSLPISTPHLLGSSNFHLFSYYRFSLPQSVLFNTNFGEKIFILVRFESESQRIRFDSNPNRNVFDSIRFKKQNPNSI